MKSERRLSVFPLFGRLSGSLCPFFLALESIGFQRIDVFLLMIRDFLEEFAYGHLLGFPDVHEVMVLVSHGSNSISALFHIDESLLSDAYCVQPRYLAERGCPYHRRELCNRVKGGFLLAAPASLTRQGASTSSPAVPTNF
jgi:hypothetical protein